MAELPRFTHVIRRIHLYTGLLLLPWAVVYGISAILFNHPTWFSDVPVHRFGPDEIRGTNLERLPKPRDIAERVVAELQRLDSAAGYQLVRPDEAAYKTDQLLVNGKGGKTEYSVTVDLNTGTGTVRVRTPPEPPPAAPFTRTEGLSLPGTPAAEVARQAVPEVLKRLNLSADSATVPGLPPEVTFLIEREGQVWRAFYQPQTGKLTGRPVEVGEPLSSRRFLLLLHKAHSYPGSTTARWWWALLVDVMSVALVFWGLSGLVMWWQIKAVRAIGFVLLLVSVAIGVALTLGMYSALTL